MTQQQMEIFGHGLVHVELGRELSQDTVRRAEAEDRSIASLVRLALKSYIGTPHEDDPQQP